MKNRWLPAGMALILAGFMAVPVSAQGPPLPTPTPIHIVIEEKIKVGDDSPGNSGEVIEEQVAIVDELLTSSTVMDESVHVVDELLTSGLFMDESVSLVDEFDVEVSGEDEPKPMATTEPEPTETPPKATATTKPEPTKTPPKATAKPEPKPTETPPKPSASCNSSSGGAASMGHLGLITAPLMLYALRRLGRG